MRALLNSPKVHEFGRITPEQEEDMVFWFRYHELAGFRSGFAEQPLRRNIYPYYKGTQSFPDGFSEEVTDDEVEAVPNIVSELEKNSIKRAKKKDTKTVFYPEELEPKIKEILYPYLRRGEVRKRKAIDLVIDESVMDENSEISDNSIKPTCSKAIPRKRKSMTVIEPSDSENEFQISMPNSSENSRNSSKLKKVDSTSPDTASKRPRKIKSLRLKFLNTQTIDPKTVKKIVRLQQQEVADDGAESEEQIVSCSGTVETIDEEEKETFDMTKQEKSDDIDNMESIDEPMTVKTMPDPGIDIPAIENEPGYLDDTVEVNSETGHESDSDSNKSLLSTVSSPPYSIITSKDSPVISEEENVPEGHQKPTFQAYSNSDDEDREMSTSEKIKAMFSKHHEKFTKLPPFAVEIKNTAENNFNNSEEVQKNLPKIKKIEPVNFNISNSLSQQSLEIEHYSYKPVLKHQLPLLIPKIILKNLSIKPNVATVKTLTTNELQEVLSESPEKGSTSPIVDSVKNKPGTSGIVQQNLFLEEQTQYKLVANSVDQTTDHSMADKGEEIPAQKNIETSAIENTEALLFNDAERLPEQSSSSLINISAEIPSENTCTSKIEETKKEFLDKGPISTEYEGSKPLTEKEIMDVDETSEKILPENIIAKVNNDHSMVDKGEEILAQKEIGTSAIDKTKEPLTDDTKQIYERPSSSLINISAEKTSENTCTSKIGETKKNFQVEPPFQKIIKEQNRKQKKKLEMLIKLVVQKKLYSLIHKILLPRKIMMNLHQVRQVHLG